MLFILTLYSPFTIPTTETRSQGKTFYGKCPQEELELNESTGRKSFDDTSSRLEEKYGEKFWQNQTKRVIELNRRYINHKKVKEMEVKNLKNENTKIRTQLKETEERYGKVKGELEIFKKEMMSIKKKKALQKPTNVIQMSSIKDGVRRVAGQIDNSEGGSKRPGSPMKTGN